MIIHVYAPCFNEELLLPYFLRHYDDIADKIIIFDDASTDRSHQIMSSHPKVECVQGKPVYADSSRKLSDSILLSLKNNEYKASAGLADWVIVVDMDEFVFHPDLVGLLTRYKASGITLPKVEGFEMVSPHPPRSQGQLYHEIYRGFRNGGYSKNAVFDPLLDIGYAPGCHTCTPRGNVRISEKAEIRLLHYRFLGAEHFVNKYKVRRNNLSDENQRNDWGMRITVPGSAGDRDIRGLSDSQLTQHYNDILKDQHLEDVVACRRQDPLPCNPQI